MMNAANKSKRQNLKIITSGDKSLYLKDEYSSLQLESCNEKSCLVPIEYAFLLKNAGSNEIDITELSSMREDSTGIISSDDLLFLVEDTNLEVGETTTAREESTLDVCAKDKIVTTVEVEVDPPSGRSCFNDDEYVTVTDPKE